MRGKCAPCDSGNKSAAIAVYVYRVVAKKAPRMKVSTRFAFVLLVRAPLAAQAGVFGLLPTVCAAYESTPLIFRARVLQTWPSPQLPNTGMSGGPMDNVSLQVLEVFKGDPGAEITVYGSAEMFGKGGEFLVYAEPPVSPQPYTAPVSQNRLIPSIRARTGPVSSAEPAADLAWLRAYPTAPPTASIFGSVTMSYGATDIPAISVTLTGPTTATVSTGADHSYAFKDLPPGAYTVSAVLPAGYTTMLDKNTAAVTVTAKGCAEVDFPIRHDTHIRGTVTDAAGTPAANAHVGLLSPTENRTGYNIVSSRRTGADGHYDFDKNDPGGYWVALDYDGPNNNDAHLPAYYPSGSTQATAQLIHLGPADSKDNIDLVLAPPLTSVTVHLHVASADGSPVAQAHVIATDPLSPVSAMVATADANGDADITLYAGREYALVADIDGYELNCAGPVRFTAAAGLRLGTLTLDKTFNACRTLQHAK